MKESLHYDLTDDVELDDVTLLRIGRDLALVLAFVACLHVLHLQGPSVRRVHEKRLEPFVRDKHGSIYREDMRVPSSDPRHLSYFRNKQICFNNNVIITSCTIIIAVYRRNNLVGILNFVVLIS